MAKAKTEALELIKKLPDDVTLADPWKSCSSSSRWRRAFRMWRRAEFSHRQS